MRAKGNSHWRLPAPLTLTLSPKGRGDRPSVLILRLRHKTNRFVHRFQRTGSVYTGFFCAVFHHLLQEGFIVAETVIAFLQFSQHTGNGISHFTFQMTDRKSTRLNSSHVSISYAVFC